jgi:hypothetical protein
MAEQPEDLPSSYLRRFENGLRDMSARLSSIEGYLAIRRADLPVTVTRSRPSNPAWTASNAVSTQPRSQSEARGL